MLAFPIRYSSSAVVPWSSFLPISHLASELILSLDARSRMELGITEWVIAQHDVMHGVIEFMLHGQLARVLREDVPTGRAPHVRVPFRPYVAILA